MRSSLTSWETFNDSDAYQPSAVPATASCDSSRQSPLATAAAAGGSDIAKEKTADMESPVSADDVSFSSFICIIMSRSGCICQK